MTEYSEEAYRPHRFQQPQRLQPLASQEAAKEEA